MTIVLALLAQHFMNDDGLYRLMPGRLLFLLSI